MMLKSLDKMVGARGFEPPTPSLPDEGCRLNYKGVFCKPTDSIDIDSDGQNNASVNQFCTPPEIKALYLKAAEVGHRSKAGHHCHTLGSLLGIEPEHENHARRRKAGLIVQTIGMARALSDLTSNDRRTPQPITGGAS